MLTSRFMTLPEPFEAMAREMDQVFEDVVGSARSHARVGNASSTQPTAVQAPAALWEDDQHVYLEVDVPGFRREDLDLTVQDDRLIVTGERRPVERDGKCWFNEHRYGRFTRVIALSDMIDPQSIEAELECGVLHLTLHKKPEAQPHRIAINVRGGGQPEQAEQPRIEAEAAPSTGPEMAGSES